MHLETKLKLTRWMEEKEIDLVSTESDSSDGSLGGEEDGRVSEAEEENQARFDLHACRVGLTYARTRPGADIVVRQRLEVLRPATMEIWEEKHKDGTPHLHVFLEWERRFRTRNARAFDAGGYHPNIISRFRNWKAWQNYVRKNGVCKYRYPDGPESSSASDARANPVDLALGGDLRAALVAVRNDSRYLVHGQAMENNLRRLARAPASSAFSLSQFRAVRPPDAKCFFISGEPGWGKTQWAMARFPSFRFVTNLRRLNGERFSEGVIFDDMDDHIRMLPRSDLINLLDAETERDVTVPYGAVTFEAGCMRVFTTNCRTFQELLPLYAGDEAITRRFVWWRLEESLILNQ